jgi:hypothetical protein
MTKKVHVCGTIFEKVFNAIVYLTVVLDRSQLQWFDSIKLYAVFYLTISLGWEE